MDATDYTFTRTARLQNESSEPLVHVVPVIKRPLGAVWFAERFSKLV